MRRAVAGARRTADRLRRPDQVGQTLTCNNGGFTGSPDRTTISWLRNGVVIGGRDVADLRAGHG